MALALAIALASAAALILISGALASIVYFRRGCFLRGGDHQPADLERGTSTSRVADGPDPSIGTKDSPRRFHWSEIETLTRNFTSPVIGEGGFSTVYLSAHSSAVKVLLSSERLHRAFRLELDVLLRLHHPHIVRLLGFCDDRDGERGALVFEYIPNGSLHEKLHETLTPLSWSQRVSIAYKLATAMDYLHDGCDLQIVHGDIKASNVLLGEQLEPKLCDFGSARMGFSAAVQPRDAAHMVGSPGYVDPHYLRTGIVSKKSDVYSFGVLLLELITGGEAFCSEKEQLLTARMAPLLQNTARTLPEIMDPKLGMEYDAGEAAAMAAMAALCVGAQPSLRPSMADVLRLMKEKVVSASLSDSISAVDLEKSKL
ncbi:salt tolerance receptor-like cytoplasmic kinase 1 [Dioscorea cayenensis subsp. rotundata]|uniref:Salt tolerance receptor-like cytoplasmic kinase 1 n=1 Tax=Dioscorea cayennensis subsp. rotundata TaxID=55577 RepID=A0AB40CD37_DIOCR|nr:salt tolerance receptor-like cytoplasmic kinase 1 [Dioscorea cayenensis subsp. rotundata]